MRQFSLSFSALLLAVGLLGSVQAQATMMGMAECETMECCKKEAAATAGNDPEAVEQKNELRSIFPHQRL